MAGRSDRRTFAAVLDRVDVSARSTGRLGAVVAFVHPSPYIKDARTRLSSLASLFITDVQPWEIEDVHSNGNRGCSWQWNRGVVQALLTSRGPVYLHILSLALALMQLSLVLHAQLKSLVAVLAPFVVLLVQVLYFIVVSQPFWSYRLEDHA